MVNWAILKNPGNWLFVAFCLALLSVALYFIQPKEA